MIVRMVVSISGSRDDTVWPPPGATMEVPTGKART